MKILYLAYVRLPTEKAHGVQIVKTCEALADHGVEITLTLPGRKTHTRESAFQYYRVRENFKIIELTTPDWVWLGKVGFVLSMLWFSEKAKWSNVFWDADVIYSRDAFVLLQYVLLGRTLVYEAHTKPTWVSRMVARRATHVVVISEGLRDKYIEVGVPAERIVLAHDAVDPAAFATTFDQADSRKWLGIPEGKKVALYVGKIDAAKGAHTFAAASEFAGDMLCVLVGGESKEKSILQKRYPRALFLPGTPYDALPRVLAAADVLVLPNSAHDADASLYTSPLKAYAYLAAKKPIIASDVPALRNILGNSVVYARSDDAKDLAVKILDPQILSRISGISPYTWSNRAQTIIAALRVPGS